MAVVYDESRGVIRLHYVVKKAAVSYSTRTWGCCCAMANSNNCFARNSDSYSEGDSFFFFLPTRDCSAWGFYASTADIYPRSRKLSAIVGLTVISQRKKKKAIFREKGIFLYVRPFTVFPSSATARPALVYEKRKWLRLFFFILVATKRQTTTPQSRLDTSNDECDI